MFVRSKLVRCSMFIVTVSLAAFVLAGCGGRGKSNNPVAPRVDKSSEANTSFGTSERHLKIRAALGAGDFAGAERLALKAVEKKPEDAEARFLLGKSLIGQDHLSTAREHLEKAVALAPDNAAFKKTLCEVLDDQARDFVKNDKHEKAVTAWKKCLEMKYKPRQTEDNLAEAYKMWGEQLTEQKKPDEAETLYREAAAVLPESQLPRLSLARLLMASDRLLEAQIVLKNLLDGNQKNEDAMIEYARLLHRMGDIRGALTQTKKVLEIAPGNRKAAALEKELENEIALPDGAPPQITSTSPSEEPDSALVEKLTILEAAGDLKGQADLLQKALQEKSGATWAKLKRAGVLERLGNASEALSLVSSYLTEKPDDLRGRFLRARCLQLTGDLEGSLGVLQAIEADGKANAQVFNEMGQIQAKMGKFDDAQTSWKRVLQLDPENADVFFHFGQLAMEEGKFAQAKEYLDRATRKEPFNLKFRYFAGLNLKQSGNSEGAKSVWQSAKAFLNPQDPYGARILNALGEKVPSMENAGTPATSGETQLAQALGPTVTGTGMGAAPLTKTGTASPTAEDPTYRAALDAARSGKFQQAIDGFNVVLSRNPNHFNAIMNLGNSYSALGSYGDAAAIYLKALRLDKKNAFALKGLARTYENLGLNANAAGISARISEGGSEAKPSGKSNPRAFAPLAEAFLRHGLAEEALPIIKIGVDENPEMPDLLALQGEVLHRLGKDDMAEVSLKKAMEIDKQNPLPYVKLGDVYADQRQTDQAMIQYQAALKAETIDPDTMFTIFDRFRALGKQTEATEVLNKLRGMNLSDKLMQKLQERQGAQ